MNFGARLAEERKRLGLRQAEFAGLVGTDVPKQSLYETGKRELRADYLARLPDAGVDVLYVLTGERAEGSTLGADTSRLLSAFLSLPEEVQQTLTALAEAIGRHGQRETGRTLHATRQEYRGEDRA